MSSPSLLLGTNSVSRETKDRERERVHDLDKGSNHVSEGMEGEEIL